MNDDPTTDSTPAWFTPPARDGSVPQAKPAPPPPADPAGFVVDTFAVTPAGETFAEAPRDPSEWPSAPPGGDFWLGDARAGEAAPSTSSPGGTTALAPPTPLVRPIITKTRASEEIRAGEPPAIEPRGPNGGGGPGWRIREGHAAPADDEPARRLGTLLEPLQPAEEAPAFVMPRMSWEKTHQQRPMRRYMVLGAGLFALCGVAALAVTKVGPFAHGIQAPQAIGSLSQIDAPQVTATLDQLDNYERSLGASNVVTAAYGPSGQTQIVLIVVQTTAAEGAAPIDLQNFVHVLTTGVGSVGLVLDPSKSTTTTAGGTTFACDTGPASANGGTALSMCAWSDTRAAGATIDVTGLSLTDVLNETVQARAATER
jgi:hypothetical protein